MTASHLAIFGFKNYHRLPHSQVALEKKAKFFQEHIPSLDWCFPLYLPKASLEETLSTINSLSVNFSAIDVGNFSWPLSLQIEKALAKEGDIIAFQERPWSASITMVVSLLNALTLTRKKLANCRILVHGQSRYASLVSRLLLAFGAKRDHIGIFDEHGWVESGEHPTSFGYPDLLTYDGNKRNSPYLLEGVDVYMGCFPEEGIQPGLFSFMADSPIVINLYMKEPLALEREDAIVVPIACSRDLVHTVSAIGVVFAKAALDEEVKHLSADGLEDLARLLHQYQRKRIGISYQEVFPEVPFEWLEEHFIGHLRKLSRRTKPVSSGEKKPGFLSRWFRKK